MTSDEEKVMQETIDNLKQCNNTQLHCAFDFCEQHHGEFWEVLKEYIRQLIIDKGGRT